MQHSVRVRAEYFKLRDAGFNNVQACSALGINRDTGSAWWKSRLPSKRSTEDLREAKLLTPGDFDLSAEATRGLKDFGYWRQRYLGRSSTPWQVEAANLIVGWLQTPYTELVTINCPPGSGKTTLFTCDIPTWLICRDRRVRILVGSASASSAARYAGRIRQILQRTRPVPPGPSSQGAEGCLAVDYGRFRPETDEIWRRDEFTVLSGPDERSIEDKEATVSAYGQGSEFLGARANFVIWDDVVTEKNPGPSPDAIEAQRRWWENEGETRVEPGGLLVLQGQRMGAEDLYRYVLDQRIAADSDEPRYRHVVFKAHFEDRCRGDHGTADEHGRPVEKATTAYPQGCLLDPHRLPWYGANGLLSVQNKGDKYRVLYQQEDVDPQDVLIPRLWITGGRDHDGVDYPGCLDDTRGLCKPPRGLTGPFVSIATADPSPTKYWSVQWWLYHPPTDQRFLLDLERRIMDAPDFLDWNDNMGQFYGLMEEWQQRSRMLGLPITTWIVEINAAQRWLLQFDHTRRWRAVHHVDIVPHSTGMNKLDPEFGIQMLRSPYRHGQIRLPYGDKDAQAASDALIKELTRYERGGKSSDDCVMANWFFEHHLPKLARPKQLRPPRLPRPTWMRAGAGIPARLP